MEDNRWCDNCGVDRVQRTVNWYYSPSLDEVSLCTPCYRKIRDEVDDLERMPSPVD